LQAHIEQLAADNGVTVDWRDITNARAWRKSKRVRIQPIKSVVTYAVALHELGHVVGVQRGVRIDKETQAWEWAKANALVWNKRMKQTASKLLRSYVNWSRRHKTAKTPDTKHPIWRWL
jgi:hypothetical protein